MGMPVDVFSGPIGGVKEHWAMQIGEDGQSASSFAECQRFFLSSCQVEYTVGDGPRLSVPARRSPASASG